MELRLLAPDIDDGPAQMGLDLALLDAVDAEPSSAVLRFYGWSVPTLSLGYFQRHDDAISDPRWRDVAIVRRPTGGGAIWHDRDLTYAIVVPRSHPAAAWSRLLYQVIHAAFAGALRDLGIDAARRADREGRNESEPASGTPFLCFLDRDPDDLVVDGHKVLGSAQRRRPRAVLQHGSLMVRGSSRTPELAGIDRWAPQIDPTSWLSSPGETSSFAAGVSERLAERLALEVVPGEASIEERLAARELAEGTFASRSWTLRR